MTYVISQNKLTTHCIVLSCCRRSDSMDDCHYGSVTTPIVLDHDDITFSDVTTFTPNPLTIAFHAWEVRCILTAQLYFRTFYAYQKLNVTVKRKFLLA